MWPAGTDMVNRLPFPGALSISKLPPIKFIRSRMLNNPNPTPELASDCAWPGSKPTPSSLTMILKLASPIDCRSTLTLGAFACLAALNNNSRTDSNRRILTSSGKKGFLPASQDQPGSRSCRSSSEPATPSPPGGHLHGESADKASPANEREIVNESFNSSTMCDTNCGLTS